MTCCSIRTLRDQTYSSRDQPSLAELVDIHSETATRSEDASEMASTLRLSLVSKTSGSVEESQSVLQSVSDLQTSSTVTLVVQSDLK